MCNVWKEKNIRQSYLYNEKYTSCRCQISKHGMVGSKIYSVYSNIKYRCNNKNCHAFKDYGGKGVKMCNEWEDSDVGFINFCEWAIDNGYKEGLTIDRIDSNGNYEPNNCRWITLSENVAYANKENVRRRANNGSYYGISPKGERYEFDNASKFSKENNLNAGCVRAVANKSKKSYKGWIFGFINE